MRLFINPWTEKSVLASVIALGIFMSGPTLGRAHAGTWEKVGSNSAKAEEQLIQLPPRLSFEQIGNIGDVPEVAAEMAKIVAETASKAEKADVPEELVAENTDTEESVSADASYYNDTYIVQRGDTLGKIASDLLGSAARWQVIARANPGIDPNRLSVGTVLNIPQTAQNNYSSRRVANYQPALPIAAPTMGAYQSPNHYAPAMVSSPSFDQSPAFTAPPPPPPSYSPSQSSKSYGTKSSSSYSAPSISVSQPVTSPPAAPRITPPNPPLAAAPPSITSPAMMQPPPYNPSYQAVPVAPPTEVPTYQPAPMAPPSQIPSVIYPDPVAYGRYDIYREERYRIPDELKPSDYTPYFINANGFHGLFLTETAFIPQIRTWNIGFGYRYENLKYLNGKSMLDGSGGLAMFHLNYAKNKFFVGMSTGYQHWSVGSPGGPDAKMSGMHDTSLKCAYQVWKNYSGDHAVALHLDTKFSSGNYHYPIYNPAPGIQQYTGGKSKAKGVEERFEGALGPMGATRGNWVELGMAYSGKKGDKINSHFNLGIANDSTDDITKLHLRGGADYRVNQHFALVGEAEAARYSGGENDATNIDLLLGFMLFNDNWEFSLGFPISVKRQWGYQSDFGTDRKSVV